FLLAGLLPWLWLSAALQGGATSITSGGNLVSRAGLPPQVLPAVAVLSHLIHFLFALPVAVIAALVLGLKAYVALPALPLIIVIEGAFLYGAALLSATLTVRFRDVQFLVQNLLVVWFFL